MWFFIIIIAIAFIYGVFFQKEEPKSFLDDEEKKPRIIKPVEMPEDRIIEEAKREGKIK